MAPALGGADAQKPHQPQSGTKPILGFPSSAGHPYTSFPAQTVPHPENIRNVDSVVSHAKEHPQRLEIQTYTLAVIVNVFGRQFYGALLYIFSQTIKYPMVIPTISNFLELAGNGHAVEAV